MSTSATEITIRDLADRLDAVLANFSAHSPRFLTIDGAACHVSLSTESIRRLLESGKLEARRPVKGRVLIDRLELENLVLTSNARPRTGRGLR